MKNHCIDVFFRYHDIPIHVLTYGSLLPVELNDLESNRNEQQRQARQMQRLNETGNLQNRIQAQASFLNYMRQLIQEAGDEFNQEDLVSWFLPYAELGFYTYDCISSDDRQSVFKLVATPRAPINALESLPRFNHIEIIRYLGESMVPEEFAWVY